MATLAHDGEPVAQFDLVLTDLRLPDGSGLDILHRPSQQVKIEDVAKAIGIENVDVIDMMKNPDEVEKTIARRLSEKKTSVIITRRPCILSMKLKAKR